jgi:rlfA
MEYNVYCDESCHLVSNDSKYMLIGAVYCPKSKVKKVNEYIEHLKENYNISNKIELKWNKIDKKTEKLYLDIINYFFNNDDLKFRVIVIDKTKLDHEKYNQTENEFYHKTYYEMLKYIIIPGNSYNIYPDIKDTNSYYYHQVMLDYLRIKMQDTNKKTIKKVQPIRSYEAPILQISDILIGALSYYYRNLSKNSVKLNIINEIKKLYQNDFDTSSYYSNTKFNIFIWRSRDDTL